MSYNRWRSVSVFEGYNGAGRFVLQQKMRVFTGGEAPEKVVPLDEHRVVAVEDLEPGGEFFGESEVEDEVAPPSDDATKLGRTA